MGKFSAVIRLNHPGHIAKIDDRALHKVYRAVAAVFLGIEKTSNQGLTKTRNTVIIIFVGRCRGMV